MIKSILKRIIKFIRKQLNKKVVVYHTIITDELPDIIHSDVIYVLGKGSYLWSVAMTCPCGCGETLHMSLHKEGRPRWDITFHDNGTVSLFPSIWRTHGCYSHFFFEKGSIRWISNIKRN